MKIYHLHETHIFPVSLQTAWEFFSNPHNLALLTPPALGLRPSPDLPSVIYPGLIITYRLQVLAGFPVTWVTEITQVIEGRLFVDEQRFGPYKFWHHEHHFREAKGGTEITDRVTYALPLGPLGRLMHRLLVRREPEGIFEFRRQVLAKRFPSGPRP